jgi:hypothetical protein
MHCTVTTLLYNARAVDPTKIVPHSDLASQLTTATQETMQAINQLLDYCFTSSDASMCCLGYAAPDK